MATYDYKCNNCGTKKEVSHHMSATPDIWCSCCCTKYHQPIKMEKLISPGSNPVFKGSGFYSNDYKGK